MKIFYRFLCLAAVIILASFMIMGCAKKNVGPNTYEPVPGSRVDPGPNQRESAPLPPAAGPNTYEKPVYRAPGPGPNTSEPIK